MSNYSDDYRARRDEAIVKQWCPAWADKYPASARLSIAVGEKAKKELAELHSALVTLERARRA